MTNYDILTCPFCGSNPQVHNCADYSVIFCSCGIRGKEDRGISGATTEDRIQRCVDQWNTRVKPSATDPFRTYTYYKWDER